MMTTDNYQLLVAPPDKHTCSYYGLHASTFYIYIGTTCNIMCGNENLHVTCLHEFQGQSPVRKPVAPVVQVVNLEFYSYLSPSSVRAPGGSDIYLKLFAKIKIKMIQLLIAPCSVGRHNSMRVDEGRKG